MLAPNLLPLTYLAQVRQLVFKNVKLNYRRVYTMRPILPIKRRKKLGISHKVIVTIGIVRGAGLEEQNKNMVAWLMVAGTWPEVTICILSPLRAKGRK